MTFVAACEMSVGTLSKIYMANAFFFWFLTMPYIFEVIIEHDIFGKVGFSSGGGGNDKTPSAPKEEKKNKTSNPV